MHRIALLTLLVACGKSEDAKPAAAPIAQGSFATLKATLDGPLAVDRAFIKQTSPDAYAVVVGAGAGSCEELLSGTDKTPAGAKSFGFSIVKRVAPDGHASYWITDLWSRSYAPKLTLPIAATFEGSADKGAKATIGFTAADAKFSAAGSFTAIGCGEVPPTGLGVPKDGHKVKAKVQISGLWIPIRGVTVQARAGVAPTDLPDIVISTNVKDCSTVVLPAPIILERTNGAWTMRGTWFEQPIAATGDAAKDLTFTANSVDKSADGPTLVLQLSGAGKIGDYSVRIEGSAEAIECVR